VSNLALIEVLSSLLRLSLPSPLAFADDDGKA
jgi:hypothetical protein